MERGWLRLAPTVILVAAVFASGDRWSVFVLVAAVAGTVPLVWLGRAPIWLVTGGLVVVAMAGLALSLASPNGLGILLVYVALGFAVRSMPNITTFVMVPVCAAAVIVNLTVRAHGWPDFVASTAGFVALILAGQNRRQRQARIEQTELALARAQTAREEHARAAALAERARIAREMHDVLAHSLAGLALNLQGARLVLVRDGASDEAIHQVERAQQLATEGLAEARRAVAALRADQPRSIEDLVAQYGPEAHLRVVGDGELAADARDALYRAAQETLTNVRKHAPGAKVDVLLEHLSDMAALTVTNRGGRQGASSGETGYGLTGMRERAELLGGTFEAGPVEDGWRVHLTVPRGVA
ncbi:histidine kinase [Kibdelosporangium lantanae]